jgi:predicted ArsR family transcriptional regulator
MARGVRTVNDSEIVNYMREEDDPAFTAGELAEELGMTSEGMRNRLEELCENGCVHKKKPGHRTVLWWANCDHPDPACSL